MKMSAMLCKCLGDTKHLEVNLGRCGGWGVERRAILGKIVFTSSSSLGTQTLTLAPSSVLPSFHACQLFTKLVHTENFSSARKTLKKHAQSSLRMMEKNAGQGSLKVPRESLSAGISLKLQGVTFYYCDWCARPLSQVVHIKTCEFITKYPSD